MGQLKTSKVHRKLDTRLKILGLEIMDLLAVLMFAALSNLFLGRLKLAPVFVILIPAIMAVSLYIIKRNKPEGFLLHFLRYIFSAGLYSAGQVSESIEEKRKRFFSEAKKSG